MKARTSAVALGREGGPQAVGVHGLDVDLHRLAGPLGDDGVPLVVDLEHEPAGALLGVAEVRAEHVGDVAHEVDRVVPHDRAPGPRRAGLRLPVLHRCRDRSWFRGHHPPSLCTSLRGARTPAGRHRARQAGPAGLRGGGAPPGAGPRRSPGQTLLRPRPASDTMSEITRTATPPQLRTCAASTATPMMSITTPTMMRISHKDMRAPFVPDAGWAPAVGQSLQELFRSARRELFRRRCGGSGWPGRPR